MNTPPTDTSGITAASLIFAAVLADLSRDTRPNS